jgi:hypothetical protein
MKRRLCGSVLPSDRRNACEREPGHGGVHRCRIPNSGSRRGYKIKGWAK